MNFELNPFLYRASEDEMADGLEKASGAARRRSFTCLMTLRRSFEVRGLRWRP